MRNWTLTPAVILSLGAWAGIVAADTPLPTMAELEAPGRQLHQRHPEALNLAGAIVAAHQTGPIHSHDLDAAFVINQLGGIKAERLIAWFGDSSDRDTAIDIPLSSDRALVTLPVPSGARLDRAQLWLEVTDLTGQRARGAFHLKTA